MLKKICTKCKIQKSVYLFYHNKGGYHSWCKDCFNAASNRSKRNNYKTFERRAAVIMASCRQSSKRRNHTLEIEKQDLIDLWYKQKGICYYTKWKMKLAPSKPESVSVERINSGIGYTKKNIVLCCTVVNSMKSSYSKELFLKVCKAVTQAAGIKRPSKA